MANVGQPLKFADLKELQENIDKFFMDCKAEEIIPTITGLALALGTNRQTLLNYQEKPEYVDTIKTAKARVEAAYEQRLFQNSPTGVIFSLKNNFGWKDNTDVDLRAQYGFTQFTDEQLATQLKGLLTIAGLPANSSGTSETESGEQA